MEAAEATAAAAVAGVGLLVGAATLVDIVTACKVGVSNCERGLVNDVLNKMQMLFPNRTVAHNLNYRGKDWLNASTMAIKKYIDFLSVGRQHDSSKRKEDWREREMERCKDIKR